MNSRTNTSSKYIILTLMSLFVLFPVVWVFFSSFKPQSELFRIPMSFFPNTWTLENYQNALIRNNVLRAVENSVFVSIISTSLTVFINIMAGYALAKYIFPFKRGVFALMLTTMMIPLQVIMIPTFLQLKQMGMINSLWGLIIPPVASPTGVLLARQYMHNVPDSMIEAARIDGAHEWTIFWRIVCPVAKPVIANIAVFSFMWRWNDYLWPLIVISDEKKKTLQLAVASFIGDVDIKWSMLLSMTTLAIIPVIIVFIFFQKFFMSGVTSGAVKG